MLVRRLLPSLLLCLPTLVACRHGAADRGAAAEGPARPPSNRIDVPEQVRRNLGLQFAVVERRRVAATLRLPARVELLPTATHVYPAPFGGRVVLAVEPLQQVAAGDLLATIDSPDWQDRRRELGELESAVLVTAQRLAAMPALLLACERHEQGLRQAFGVLQEHIEGLDAMQANVGGQALRLTEARIELARLQALLAEADEKHTETQTRHQELDSMLGAARERFALAVQAAAAALGLDAATLGTAQGESAWWRRMHAVELRATAPGVVDRLPLANGQLVAAHSEVLTTIDPSRVRCRAHALQSDLVRLAPGLPTTLVTADRGSGGDRVAGLLHLGIAADPRQRTVELFITPLAPAPFLRPGVVLFAEIETATSAAAELAIPRAALQRDGTARVFFRRDPGNPDVVIRTVADRGVDDGRWVEIRSGLADGDEVVTAGAYELVLASSAETPKGGHFHADGTWHEDH